MHKKNYVLITTVLASLSTVCYAAPQASPPPASQNVKNPKPSNAEAFNAFTGKITGNKVRLRNQPDLDGKVIKDLNKGDYLIVVGENNGYYAVKPPKGTKAYVFRSYILDNVVEGTHVNVRLEPNLEAAIIGQLNSGERVQGTISTINNKWLEIDAPPSARFYVAKEYVQSVGSPDVLDKIQKRRNDVDSLLNSAYSTSQNELRKPFDQISLDQIYQQFNKIIKDYPDFPEQIAKAKEALDIVQKTYLQKQIAFLESKTQQTEQSFKTKQASINAEIEGYQKKLADLEAQLQKERAAASSVVTTLEAPVAQKDSSSSSPTTPPPAEKKVNITSQMNHWVPIEKEYYQLWLKTNPPGTIDDFYKAETAKSITLAGTLEPFSKSINNRPGDYLLKVNNLPAAYLYSTRVDLENYVGQTVKVTAIPRPNSHFAYPAYFVYSVD